MTPFPDVGDEGGIMPVRVRLFDEPGPHAGLTVKLSPSAPRRVAGTERIGGCLPVKLPPGSATAPAGFVTGRR